MIFFTISLRAADGSLEELGTLQFASLADVCADVRVAIPDLAAELIREGNDPFDYAFVIHDEGGRVLQEVPLTSALRSEAGARAGPPTISP